MLDKCNECTNFRNLNEVVTRLLDKFDGHDKRIAKLERFSDVTQEKLSNIDKTLTKIDGGIESLGKKIDNVDKKPSKFLDKVLSAVTGGVVTFIVIELVKIFRHGG